MEIVADFLRPVFQASHKETFISSLEAWDFAWSRKKGIKYSLRLCGARDV